jgi:transcriptional regulator with XRE-family HTH domain
MSFRENLKEALDFKGMLVKELADKTKISRRTLDNYLRSDASIPPADNAVRIAGALGVSVEYLVTGDERRSHPPLPPGLRQIARAMKGLDGEKQRIVADTAVSLAERLKGMGESRGAGGRSL